MKKKQEFTGYDMYDLIMDKFDVSYICRRFGSANCQKVSLLHLHWMRAENKCCSIG